MFSRPHAVRFFQDEAKLVETVCDYVSAGYELGERAVLAVEPRRAGAVKAELAVRGYGRFEPCLTVLCAEKLAERLSAKGEIGAAEFNRLVTPSLKAALADSPAKRVRAYGEIADVYWRSGRESEAVRLESLWIDLGKRMPLRLLCGYGIDPLDSRCWTLAERHDAVVRASELDPRDAGVERALEAALGAQAGMLRMVIAGESRLSTLPFGQAALIWLGFHMPATAQKIAASVKAGGALKQAVLPKLVLKD